MGALFILSNFCYFFLLNFNHLILRFMYLYWENRRQYLYLHRVVFLSFVYNEKNKKIIINKLLEFNVCFSFNLTIKHYVESLLIDQSSRFKFFGIFRYPGYPLF